jgi:hypothetical protein
MAEFAYNFHTYQLTGMILFEANIGYNSRVPIYTLSITRLYRLSREYPKVSFATHIVDILKDLRISLVSTLE